MKFVKLQGTDASLYELVGPLVMNPAVLRQNNNYPFKTGMRYTWYIAIQDGLVAGFLPVKKTSAGQYVIDNYYLRGDDTEVLTALLARILGDQIEPTELWAVAHKRHAECFVRNGFRSRMSWKNYDKMQYCTD